MATPAVYPGGHTLSLPDALPLLSPGSSGKICEMYDTIAAGPKTRSSMRPSCTSSPSTVVVIRAETGTSSTVARTGPTGVEFSKLLHCSHCRVRFCQSSEEHTSELPSLMRISNDVFCFQIK